MNNYSKKKITSYKNKHKGNEVLVCGLGPSLLMIDKKNLSKTLTIGVNDINVHFIPDYQIISEPIDPNRFKNNPMYQEKCNQILDTECETVFSRHDINLKHSKPIHTEMEDLRKVPDIASIFRNGVLPACRKITTAGISLAIYMGFKRIGIIGFDLRGERAVNEKTNALNMAGKHLKTMNDNMKLYNNHCRQKKIEIYNLSPVSEITAFPRMTIREFYG